MGRRLVLLLVAGCTATTDGAPTNMCPMGKCPVANSFFAAEVSPISPASNATLPGQEVAQVFIDSDNRFSITLERAITLGGIFTDEKDGTPVPAGIILSRPSHIPGRPDVFYITRAGDKGDWSVVVSPAHDGEIYTLRVQPDDSAHRPPQVFLIDGSRDRTFMLPLANPANLLQIHGTVTDALQLPVVGMQVQAHDPMISTPVSTTAVTDAQGSFALRATLAPTSLLGSPTPPVPLGSVKLVATPPQTQMPGNWVPRLEQAVDVSRAGSLNSLTVNLSLPPLPTAAQLVYSVVGVGPSGKEVQVAGAHCQFTADVSDPKSETRAYYEVGTETDATGKAAVMLIPATDVNRDYQVAVSPPSSSEFQALATMVSVGPAGGYGASIQLPLRAQVTGKILGPDGAPLRSLTIVPYAATLATLLGPEQNTMAKLTDTITDATGSFVLRVDDGNYDLALLPLASSMLPRWWIENQAVSGDLALDPVSLPPASPVVGAITDAAGMPLGGADVRLYMLPAHNISCAATDYACLSPPRLIAEGTAGLDGNVSVLLPGSPN